MVRYVDTDENNPVPGSLKDVYQVVATNFELAHKK